MSPQADDATVAECRAIMARHSKSFDFAARFLAPAVRDETAVVYAYLRRVDDAIDEAPAEERPRALAELREELDAIYGSADLPFVPAAFRYVVRRRRIPRLYLEELLAGMAMDVEEQRYATDDDLLRYCHRAAGVVGLSMCHVLGLRDDAALIPAVHLGWAMQLTNICRDVGEDARNGRVYLPLDWLREEGLDVDAWLADPVYNDAVGAVTKRVLDLAETLYQRAEAGIAKLPVPCRPGIYAARLLYAEIGREVARNGYDSVSRRAVVASTRKVTLLSRAVAATPFPGRGCTEEALSENQFLVDAAATRRRRATPAAATVRSASGAVENGGPQSVGDKLVWVLDLFATLDERQRMGGMGRDNGLMQATSGGGYT